MDFARALRNAAVALVIVVFAIAVYEILGVSKSTEGYDFIEADNGSKLEKEIIHEDVVERAKED